MLKKSNPDKPNSMERLKAFLDEKVRLFNTPDFIKNDPVSVPHRFSRNEDIEISGFIAATLAWGNRAQIIASSLKVLEAMDHEPFRFITTASEREFSQYESFVHRTFSYPDLLWFLHAFRHIFDRYGSLQAVFEAGYQRHGSIKDGILKLRAEMLHSAHLKRSEKHVADPSKGSAAKRLNMFLRWMVRNDGQGVDFGLWKHVDPAHLMCPLDTHSGRIARKLSLLARTQNDWKAVEELTESLRHFDASDPVKYDFALFGTGVTMGRMNPSTLSHLHI